MDFEQLSTVYFGNVATSYVERRTDAKWRSENRALAQLLQYVPRGACSLDAPVGTGRSLAYTTAREFDAHGIDISADMLQQARTTAERLGAAIDLRQGDIRALPFPDNRFDVVICLRFLNWIDGQGFGQVMRELTRVTRDKLLVGVRYLPPLDHLGGGGADLLRRLMLRSGLSRYRATRRGLVSHPKALVHDMFAECGLKLYAMRMVERRWDGTEYAFFLLLKT
ncbi:class I SAM-dependent methyltransferase [Sphingomonas ginkgonis]|uniref:Class I SAM-dependent methyltransferase n=1 Tax=Sphingomonas ginkgonis TaxID=2315330 RepID=A0A3R9YND6_9SPHN|nr:class I SAM-dependent methyltransferase [Sphingomonas ginkgonis]RST31440.1 class I SAM-dependent methyltransferase [Sphingomonas ginkgonis]